MDAFRHFPTFLRHHHAFVSWYRAQNRYTKFVINFFATAAVLYLVYIAAFAPPWGYPSGVYITVPKGSSLTSIAIQLKTEGVISYAWVLKDTARVLGGDKHIPAGVYYFPEPESAVSIAIRLVAGDFETTPVRITVPEGSTVSDISKLLLQKMPDFNRQEFLAVTRGKEGYLFPDTYFFMPGDSIDSILSVFNNGFHTHIAKVQKQIDIYGQPLSDVLTMASLLEKEASKTADRQMIAGILWHRIKLGMPLQVDAVFPYFLNKSATKLTLDDLKVDNPYNTYIHKGLPPGPIANPGLDSILAAVTPTKSNYLYYLSDRGGNFHFATTYEEFLAYKHKYLD
ncbi:MAG: endolytic transglycosylase MltG [Patescibacteria group bacterium]